MTARMFVYPKVERFMEPTTELEFSNEPVNLEHVAALSRTEHNILDGRPQGGGDRMKVFVHLIQFKNGAGMSIVDWVFLTQTERDKVFGEILRIHGQEITTT